MLIYGTQKFPPQERREFLFDLSVVRQLAELLHFESIKHLLQRFNLGL